jgi:hypothetical protein
VLGISAVSVLNPVFTAERQRSLRLRRETEIRTSLWDVEFFLAGESIQRVGSSVTQNSVVPVHDSRLDHRPLSVKRNQWTIVKRQAHVKYNAANDNERREPPCKHLPAVVIQKSVPAIQAIDQRNWQYDIKMV